MDLNQNQRKQADSLSRKKSAGKVISLGNKLGCLHRYCGLASGVWTDRSRSYEIPTCQFIYFGMPSDHASQDQKEEAPVLPGKMENIRVMSEYGISAGASRNRILKRLATDAMHIAQHCKPVGRLHGRNNETSAVGML